MINKKSIQGRRSYNSGIDAENLVKKHLIQQGFHILLERVKTPHGEIDIVVSNFSWLIAIEVKKRHTFTQGASALSNTQKRRLLNSFDYLISTKPEWVKPNIRFDVYIIDCFFNINLIEDAIRLY